MSKATPGHPTAESAAAHLAQVIEEIIRRRTAGDALPDEEVISVYPELMPELGEKLHALHQVEQAGRLAKGADAEMGGHTETFLACGDDDSTRPGDAATLPSDSFAGYQLLREIHRGGQGVVYQAIQKSTKRKVAIKVMKDGPFAGPGDRARFEREVEILGQLSHPNIVTVHDSGSAAGVYYFVMDYISGQPLDVYMAGKAWSIAETLRLFAKICEAVNAAHLKGVIHRDLKPGNIRIDPNGEPHVLDFGLAKVARGAEAASLMTMTGQFMGSLPWSSPEQAEAVPSKIDIRTDVYSLGVILYQMLTGKFPYDVIGNMRDVLDRILTTEPAKPSTARKQINDEVETIVLKCLSKERERRYQTAGELARDIHRYLAGEPIEARPPSMAYQFRIFARRHKAAFGALAAVFLVLLAATIVSTSLYVRAERARRDTLAVRDFLKDMISSADPGAAHPGLQGTPAFDFTVREMLEVAKDRVHQFFAEQPALEAEMRLTLARAFYAVGDFVAEEGQAREAVRLRSQVLGPQHPATFAARSELTIALNENSKDDEALQEGRDAYVGLRRTLGAGHPDTLRAGRLLARMLSAVSKLGEAETLLRELLLAFERLGPQYDESRVWTRAELAYVIVLEGRLREGEDQAREAITLGTRTIGPHHTSTANAKGALGLALLEEGRCAEAEVACQERADDYRNVCGVNHPYALATIVGVVNTVALGGDPQRAEDALRKAIDRTRAQLKPGDDSTLYATSELPRILNLQQKFLEAERVARDVAGRMPPAEVDVFALRVRDQLAVALYGQGRLEEAEQAGRELVHSTERLFPDGRYFELPQFRNHWGRCLVDLGRYDEAEQQLKAAYDGEMAMRGPEHRNTREVIASLVRLYAAWNRADEASIWRAKLVEWQASTQPTGQRATGPRQGPATEPKNGEAATKQPAPTD